MQLSNNNNRSLGIVQDIDFLCGTTSGTYPLADKVRNINQAYMDVSRVVWDSVDGWQFDDSNATDLPIATTNLVQNQGDYTLPSTAQKLRRVSIMDGQGTYRFLKPFNLMEMQVDPSVFPSYGKTGQPMYYDLVGRSLLLYPVPVSGAAGTTLTSGLRVYFDRDVTLFTTASTTAAPGFATSFHRILSYSAAIDFTKDNVIMQRWLLQKKELTDGLIRFYSRREYERVPKIRPYGRQFKYTYR